MSPRSRTLALASGIALLAGALIFGLFHGPRSAAVPLPAPSSALPSSRPLPSPGVRTRAEAPANPPASVSASSDPRERRLARAEMTLQAYLTATRYPPDSRPIEERPDLALLHHAPVRTLPLAGPDRPPTSARVTLRQDRYFAAAEEHVTLGLTCSSTCQVISAVAVRPPDMPGDAGPAPLTFSEDGEGGFATIFEPARQGFSAYHGPLRVEVELRVGQESGSASFDLHYTPVPPARFTGAVREAMVRGSLELYIGIKVDKAGRYVLRARMDDADGKPFAFLSDNEVLADGAREARLRLFGKLVHDAHARAPFRLRDLEGFLLEENTSPDRASMVDLEGTIYTTRRYAEGELSEAEWDSDEKANHLRELTRDVERASSDPPARSPDALKKTSPMRRFNTAGPCRPAYDYMIPPERRMPEAARLVDHQAYFALHAPRQTGKTTTMHELAHRLTEAGRYAALHFSCERARAFPEDVAAAEKVVLSAIAESAELDLPEALRPPARTDADPGTSLGIHLTSWAKRCTRPLVLIFDEIDAIEGNSLKSILSQLRAGFPTRPAAFPWSVILCGMRDVRDYKAASGGGPVRLGSSSPFNIKEESIRLGNFDQAEVRELYGQHTGETGQVFTEDALDRAWELTQGQPWLVNALAREIVEKIGVPATEPITAAHMDLAKERLILARATHLDSLLARLREDRVQRVIEPVLAGELPERDPLDDDYQYVTDLGLLAPDLPVRIANPIYREIILRVLASLAERAIVAEPRSYVAPDGRLDIPRLVRDFADFWREHGDILATRMPYPEVASQLVIMAWLHRIVNGGGLIDREVGIGRKRIDLVVRWPFTDAAGKRAVQRTAFELKVWRDRDKSGDPLLQGMKQLDEYLENLGLDEGILVVFDARSAAPPIEERTRFEDHVTPSGRRITVLRA